MKSPGELQSKLSRDWQTYALRRARLVEHAFPIRLAIGLPAAKDIGSPAVRAHLAAWQAFEKQGIGTVIWQRKKYRACAGEIDCPAVWEIDDVQTWQAAMDDRQGQAELAWFIALTEQDYWREQCTVSPQFAREQLALLLRHKALALPYCVEVIVQLLIVAAVLPENAAQGLPLRALHRTHLKRIGVEPQGDAARRAWQEWQADSKFFERHRILLGKLLALRFGRRVIEQGVDVFLGAQRYGGWLHVYENQTPRRFLPYAHMCVQACDLRADDIPLSRILIVENLRCLHTLPPLPDTCVILGAGRNLAWLQDRAWRQKSLYYWGDLDTWGLDILALAQSLQPHIFPLMMDLATFEQHAEHALGETDSCPNLPATLDKAQKDLFVFLQRGAWRLEQEFIRPDWVRDYCRRHGLCR